MVAELGSAYQRIQYVIRYRHFPKGHHGGIVSRTNRASDEVDWGSVAGVWAKQDKAITELREGAIAIISLKIKEAEDMRTTLEKQLADTTEGCQKLLEKVIEGEGRTSTNVENPNTMNTKVYGVSQIMVDWLIEVEQN